MSVPAIRIQNFTKRFGKITAVDNLSLEVPKGSIFGLLGQNGAGKTTTIRTLLNLLRPTEGSLQVLGLDSVKDSLEIRKRIGYLPEEPSYYSWMTVDEIISFNAAFYSTWDHDLGNRLLDDLGLPRDRKLGSLSRGMQAKVGLVMALGPRPELLILDDPTSGLDPVVRHEFLEAMISNVQSEGGTVFFSTHLLHEMERVADEVAMIHHGTLRLRNSLEQMKMDFKKLRAVYPNVVPDTFPIEGLVRAERNAHQALLTVARYDPAMDEALRGHGAETVEVLDLPLEEIFVETDRDHHGGNQERHRQAGCRQSDAARAIPSRVGLSARCPLAGRVAQRARRHRPARALHGRRRAPSWRRGPIRAGAAFATHVDPETDRLGFVPVLAGDARVGVFAGDSTDLLELSDMSRCGSRHEHDGCCREPQRVFREQLLPGWRRR